MRISDSKHIIDLSDKFDKIRKFFSEHSSNTITAHIYDNRCVMPNFVLTAVMRNNSNQYITFVAFDLHHTSDEMEVIFSEHCSMINIGEVLHFVSPFVDILVEPLLPNTHTIAKLIKKYIHDNNDELQWLEEDGTMYGFEIYSTQLLTMDGFFTLCEHYIVSKNKAAEFKKWLTRER